MITRKQREAVKRVEDLEWRAAELGRLLRAFKTGEPLNMKIKHEDKTLPNDFPSREFINRITVPKDSPFYEIVRQSVGLELERLGKEIKGMEMP